MQGLGLLRVVWGENQRYYGARDWKAMLHYLIVNVTFLISLVGGASD